MIVLKSTMKKALDEAESLRLQNNRQLNERLDIKTANIADLMRQLEISKTLAGNALSLLNDVGNGIMRKEAKEQLKRTLKQINEGQH